MKSKRNVPSVSPLYVYENAFQSNRPIENQSILIFEDDELIAAKYKRQLRKANFTDVTFATSTSNFERFFGVSRFNLILLDNPDSEYLNRSLRILNAFRSRGCNCPIAMTSGQPSVELYYRAAIMGANDVLVKGRFCEIVYEVTRLLQSSRTVVADYDSTEEITNTGFFRTLGLSKSEIEVLSEYARDYPRYEILARRMGTSPTRLRKTFSRIFEKLERTLLVDNTAKLAHVLTICSLYNAKRFEVKAISECHTFQTPNWLLDIARGSKTGHLDSKES